MEFIKKNFKYLFIFIFSLSCMSFLLSYFDGDVLWNYGFSYAISRGEIPYLDFNMIITPFYSFLMSIPLLINSNILIFYICNSLLIVWMFYYLFKMFDYKAWLFLILLVFPIPVIVMPTYNLFLIFLFVLIIYLEKNKCNDYLIGFIIAISFLSKQSVGLFLLIPSLIYYRKDIKKILKRFSGFIILCILFLIYLIITKSITRFFDLCLFGLFDFTGSNSNKNIILLIIGLLLIVFSIILFIKNKKDIRYLYVLMFSSIMIPLFDIPHIEYFLFCFSVLFIEKININKKALIFNSLLISCCLTTFFFMLTTYNKRIDYPNKYHNFNYRLNPIVDDTIRDGLIKYIKDSNKNIYILSTDAYFYKITCDMNIDYFDLNNMGNHGYNGTDMMIERIKKLDNKSIVIVNELESNKSTGQFNKVIGKYVINNLKKIKTIGVYGIYLGGS